jgi:hypothetical protein
MRYSIASAFERWMWGLGIIGWWRIDFSAQKITKKS